jgi:DNA-binding IscR family transcriptional regulator
MKFVNRQMEIALNVMQLMFSSKPDKRQWTLPELAEQLNESELFTYQVLRELRGKGYVYSVRGVKGGYSLMVGVEAKSLAQFFNDFNKKYLPNPTMDARYASEKLAQVIAWTLSRVTLRTVFEVEQASTVLSMTPEPEGAA